MKTIIAISTQDIWSKSLVSGHYTNSTIHSTLDEVGFVHCTTPSQTMEVIPRFKDVHNVVLLLIDSDKLSSPVQFEPSKSGREGLFPHIYGSLNIDAVYDVVKVPRDHDDNFLTPKILKDLTSGA